MTYISRNRYVKDGLTEINFGKKNFIISIFKENPGKGNRFIKVTFSFFLAACLCLTEPLLSEPPGHDQTYTKTRNGFLAENFVFVQGKYTLIIPFL